MKVYVHRHFCDECALNLYFRLLEFTFSLMLFYLIHVKYIDCTRFPTSVQKRNAFIHYNGINIQVVRTAINRVMNDKFNIFSFVS